MLLSTLQSLTTNTTKPTSTNDQPTHPHRTNSMPITTHHQSDTKQHLRVDSNQTASSPLPSSDASFGGGSCALLTATTSSSSSSSSSIMMTQISQKTTEISFKVVPSCLLIQNEYCDATTRKDDALVCTSIDELRRKFLGHKLLLQHDDNQLSSSKSEELQKKLLFLDVFLDAKRYNSIHKVRLRKFQRVRDVLGALDFYAHRVLNLDALRDEHKSSLQQQHGVECFPDLCELVDRIGEGFTISHCNLTSLLEEQAMLCGNEVYLDSDLDTVEHVTTVHDEKHLFSHNFTPPEPPRKFQQQVEKLLNDVTTMGHSFFMVNNSEIDLSMFIDSTNTYPSCNLTSVFNFGPIFKKRTVSLVLGSMSHFKSHVHQQEMFKTSMVYRSYDYLDSKTNKQLSANGFRMYMIGGRTFYKMDSNRTRYSEVRFVHLGGTLNSNIINRIIWKKLQKDSYQSVVKSLERQRGKPFPSYDENYLTKVWVDSCRFLKNVDLNQYYSTNTH